MAAKRTKRGNVTAATRKQHGSKGGRLKKGSFPVFDQRSAKAALRLRGHAKSKKAVVDKVSRFASKTNSPTLKAAVKKARKKDRT